MSLSHSRCGRSPQPANANASLVLISGVILVVVTDMMVTLDVEPDEQRPLVGVRKERLTNSDTTEDPRSDRTEQAELEPSTPSLLEIHRTLVNESTMPKLPNMGEREKSGKPLTWVSHNKH